MHSEENRKSPGDKSQTAAGPSPSTVIPRRPTGAIVPLSFSQRQLWFLHRTMPTNAAYNIPTLLRFEKPLNIEILCWAVNELVRRHEVLRTRFVGSEGEPVQVIEQELTIEVEREDLAEVRASDREQVLEKRLLEETRRAFDLERLPLLRVRLLELGEEKQALLVVIHHIIADGWSLPVFFRELEILYEAYRRGEERPLPNLPVQYGDYAVWQREQLERGGLQADLDYWKKQLEAAPEILELPADYSRPDKPKFDGAGEYFELNQTVVKGLKGLGRQAGATFYMSMLAAYSVVLHRYSGQDEVLIGTPAANREYEELHGLIGLFVNMLVIRVNLSGNPSFPELLKRVRDTALEAYVHQALPFELLVEKLRPERNLNRNPLFQVAFSFVGSTADAEERSVSWPPFTELNNFTFKFDMGAIVFQDSSRCRINLGYNPELFSQDTCTRFKQHFHNLLGEIVADPQAGISTLPMLLSEERQIMCDWQNTQTEYPREKRIEEIFQAQVEKAPNAPALLYHSTTFTYQELDDAAGRVGRYLRQLGVGAETVVGVCMERSWQLVVSLLGVLKAGGAYLPLDPGYPTARLQFMLEDSKARVVLMQTPLMDTLPWQSLECCRFVRYEDIVETAEGSAPLHSTPDNLAYIIYTSGSTGAPKGIGIPHRAVTRLVCNTNYVGSGANDRIAQASNPSFDAATFEIWGSLLNGGCVAGVSREESLTPKLLASRIRESKMTTMFLTTALFNQFAASDEADALGELKYLLFGGEAVDPKWVQEVLKHFPPRNLLHVYGPTENTTFSTWRRVQSVPSGSTTVSIGAPIANTEIYVLDKNMMHVATGVTGELYVGGDGLARGYVNRPELTAEKFLPNPFGLRGSERLYRTGDLVKYRSDGNIEFIGRADQQVKIRGFRIEPGEVESVLRKHAKVRDSIVLVKDYVGDKRLIAYAAVEKGAERRDLRQYLKDRLPDYMVPSKLVLLQELPLTENGKVDRQKLIDGTTTDDDEEQQEQQYVAPRNQLERAIAEIWSDMLGTEKVGVYDNIFDLGGHSLLLMAIHARMKRQVPHAVHLSVKDLFLYPTIDSLVDFMGQEESESAFLQR
jgi:amino acid adenylation domain-containing protein